MCRGIQGHPPGIFWRIYVYTVPTMFIMLFFNGLCTSNMFMVLQVVILWLYMSYKFCVIYIFDYKNIFEYKNVFYRGKGWAWANQHSMHLHSVTLSNMLRLG